MKKLLRLAFLAWPLLVAALITRCFGAQSLPDDWWLQDSPEKVLVKVLATNRDFAFFHAEKMGSPFSQTTNPFGKTNDNARVEFFQKKNADGSVETKEFTLNGNFQWTDYKLNSGDYSFSEGQIIKTEFEDGDDWEKRVNIKFDDPYEYKILKPEMAGTNDCIVIARIMTVPLLTAATENYYKKFSNSPEERKQMGEKYIRSEIDYYFRKSDGVAFGYVKRNYFGEILDDYIYDMVEINQPIPDRKFSLPNGEIKVAKSSEELQKIINEAISAKLAKARENPAATLSEKRVLELPWAADLPKALEQAKAENKIVLLDFTGSDWCVWCIKFDDDVLSQPEFASYAKTNLAMVLLDFPNAKEQSDSVKKTNKDLQEKFKVDGFPTYVALSPNGKEIGRQVGYLAGGPQAFIAELEKFRKQ
jgi:protein disulfide-isomerase